MNSYKAQGISRNDIRHIVREIRRGTNLEYTMYFPVVRFFGEYSADFDSRFSA